VRGWSEPLIYLSYYRSQTKHNWSLAAVDVDVDVGRDTMWWPNVVRADGQPKSNPFSTYYEVVVLYAGERMVRSSRLIYLSYSYHPKNEIYVVTRYSTSPFIKHCRHITSSLVRVSTSLFSIFPFQSSRFAMGYGRGVTRSARNFRYPEAPILGVFSGGRAVPLYRYGSCARIRYVAPGAFPTSNRQGA